MSKKPIPFNTEMVKATLDGRKTQTRRVIKLENNNLIPTGYIFSSTDKKRVGKFSFGKTKEQDLEYANPRYKVGDILWVRESAKVTMACNDTLKINFEYLSDGTKKTIDIPKRYLDEYDFIKSDCFLAKLNQLHYDKEYVGVPNGCLKEMARIFLKVTNVEVERLQDILVGDIIAEGYYNPDCTNHSRPHYFAEMAKKWWANLWNSTAKDGCRWEDNPYVFVYEFERVEV